MKENKKSILFFIILLWYTCVPLSFLSRNTNDGKRFDGTKCREKYHGQNY